MEVVIVESDKKVQVNWLFLKTLAVLSSGRRNDHIVELGAVGNMHTLLMYIPSFFEKVSRDAVLFEKFRHLPLFNSSEKWCRRFYCMYLEALWMLDMSAQNIRRRIQTDSNLLLPL